MPTARSLRRSASWTVLTTVMTLVVVAGTSHAADAERTGTHRHLDYIDRLRDEGRDDLAIDETHRFVREHPRHERTPSLLVSIADLERGRGNERLAIDALEQIVRDHPGSPEAASSSLTLAALLADVGRIDEAIEAYRSMPRRYPLHADVERAQLGLARLLARVDRPDEARRLLARLVASRPGDDVGPAAAYELATLEQQQGFVRRAERRFESIAEEYPGSRAGARGLMRAAELHRERGAVVVAREAYRRLLELHVEPDLRSAAHVQLASLLESPDPESAFENYRKAADEAVDAETAEVALRGMARCGLAAGRFDEVLEAAREHADRFPAADTAEWVRLYAAMAELETDGRDAMPALRALGRSTDAEVAFRALSGLARRAEERRRPVEALDHWRAAERNAPDDESRGEALVAQARLTLDAQRPTLAAEFAMTAHDICRADADRAQALLLAIRAYVDAGDRAHALALADRIVREHPLTPQATRARRAIRGIEHQPLLDPAEAARRLAVLAEHTIVDRADRAYELALIHRDRLGDLDAALELLDQAIAQATRPEQRSRMELEFGRTLQLRALMRGLDGDTHGAAESWREARRSLADAERRAGREIGAHQARLLLVAQDLAEAVAPQEPWLFDGWTMPVLGGVGVAEGIDRDDPALDAVRTRLRQARRDAETRADRAWVLWRQAEISRAGLEQRIEMARTALDRTDGGPLEWAIRSTLGQLFLLHGDTALGIRQLTRVIDGDAPSEVSMSARLAVAEAYRREGRHGEAVRWFDEYATVYPETRRGEYALLLAGDSAFYAGRSADAAFRYRKLLGDHPDSDYVDDARYRLGVLWIRSGRPDAAREPLERLANADGVSRYRGPAHARLGEIAADRGDFTAAIEHYASWVEIDARAAARADAWSRIAEWALHDDDPDRALLWLDRGLRHREPDPASLALRVRAAAVQSDVRSAAAALRRMEAGFPDARATIANARLEIAAAHRGLNELERAVDVARRARREAPDDRTRSRAAHEEGLAHARMQYGVEARDAWAEAADQDPHGPWAAAALLRRADWALRHGDLESARRDFATFVGRFPDDRRAVDALRGEARALRLAGRHDEALDRYQRILERTTEGADVDAVLVETARCHAALGQTSVAVATYRRVLPYLDGDTAFDAHMALAAGLATLGRHDAAAAEYLEVAEAFGDHPVRVARAQVEAANALEAAGRADAARELYQRVAAGAASSSDLGRRAAEGLRRTLEGTPARR